VARMDIRAIWLGNLRSERRITRETIAAMADGDMQFRPTEQQMSFGAQALHIISAQKTLLEGMQGKEWNWELGIDTAHFPTQAAILAKFDEVMAEELAYYEGLEPGQYDRTVRVPWGDEEPMVQLLYSFLAHETHHRGQMVTYLRLKGMQPPSY
jgi:uncharacterized damage-inducible protein DinB